MITNIRSRDHGVSVTIGLDPDADLRVTDTWGQKTTVQLRTVGNTFYKVPAEDETFGVTGSGKQIKQDGTVGNRDRTNVLVRPSDLPEPIRRAFIAEARRLFLAREDTDA